jgi:hypothetical protein
VVDLIETGQFEALMKCDQLQREQQAGHVLMGFHEAPVYPFPPSFKLVDRLATVVSNRYADNR